MKLLIIDDELQIRTGLAEEINWIDLGIEKVYLAENGIEAVELCENHQPEIVITDIRMPGIDGLELSRQVVDLYKPVAIIILSGYSDFNYAKEAIQFGAKAYLLKPINIDELIGVVQESIESIKYQLELSKNKSLFEQMSRKQKLMSLIEHQVELNEEKLLAFKKLISIKTTEFMLLGMLSVDTFKYRNTNQIGIYLKSIIEDVLINQPTNMLYWNDGALLFLCPYTSESHYKKSKDSFTDRLFQINQMLKAQFNCSVSLAISSLRCMKYIPKMFIECQHALKHRLYSGEKSFLSADTLDLSSKAWISPLNTSELKRVIEVFEKKKTHQYLEELFANICEMKVTSSDFVRGVCIGMKRTLIETIQEKGINTQQLIKEYPMLVKDIPSFVTITDYDEWMNHLYSVVIEKFGRLGGKLHSRVIIQVVDYISNHYKEDISLFLLSEYTGKSKNYLGHLFKKEMNVSFVDFLNDIRIGEAKKRLKNTDEMIYEISEAVGFSDYKYFSSIFKKYVGISPLSYRKNN
jgi:two-component system, response regulator YesN